MAEIKVTKDNFKAEVLESNIPVLLDFWATWCGPCQMLAPELEVVAKELEGKVKVGKVNVDEQPELAREFNVMSIPTLIVYKDGKSVNRVMGARDKDGILDLLEIK